MSAMEALQAAENEHRRRASSINVADLERSRLAHAEHMRQVAAHHHQQQQQQQQQKKREEDDGVDHHQQQQQHHHQQQQQQQQQSQSQSQPHASSVSSGHMKRFERVEKDYARFRTARRGSDAHVLDPHALDHAHDPIAVIKVPKHRSSMTATPPTKTGHRVSVTASPSSSSSTKPNNNTKLKTSKKKTMKKKKQKNAQWWTRLSGDLRAEWRAKYGLSASEPSSPAANDASSTEPVSVPKLNVRVAQKRAPSGKSPRSTALRAAGVRMTQSARGWSQQAKADGALSSPSSTQRGSRTVRSPRSPGASTARLNKNINNNKYVAALSRGPKHRAAGAEAFASLHENTSARDSEHLSPAWKNSTFLKWKRGPRYDDSSTAANGTSQRGDKSTRSSIVSVLNRTTSPANSSSSESKQAQRNDGDNNSDDDGDADNERGGPVHRQVRKLYTDNISREHGFLSEQNIDELLKQTGYNRRELYVIYARFKALCAMSPLPGGIDKETFQRGVARLAVEDDLFVDRVFKLLDEDGSGQIEWDEFLMAMAALERGDPEIKNRFCFQTYDLDDDGFIGREDLSRMFSSSSMLQHDDTTAQVVDTFVNRVFRVLGVQDTEKITLEHVNEYMATRALPGEDVWDLFGRSMLKDFRDDDVEDYSSDDDDDRFGLRGAASKTITKNNS